MKKTAFFIISILLVALWGVLSPAARGQGIAELTRKLELLKASPDLIVVNGKISTMDTRNSEVQAMAVRNNRILAVGTNDEVRFLAGPKTEVLDAKGRRVLPGLIDGHTHPHVWAMEHWLGAEGDFTSKKYNEPQMKMVLAEGDDQAAVLRSLERVVRQRAQELGPGKWILVQLFAKKSIPEARKIVWPMFTQSGGQPGAISQQYLDTLAPNNPLMVFAGEAIGPAANNTKAKEETIRLLGYEVYGLGARAPIVYDILLRGRVDDQVDFLKRELLDCVAAQGVTTFGNHYYGSPSIMKIYGLMYQRDEMPVRWGWWEGTLWGNGSPGFSDDTLDKLAFFYRNVGDFRGIGNDYIWNAGVSNEAWETGFTCTIATPLNPAAPASSSGSIMDILSGYRPPCSEIAPKFDQQPGYQRVKAALNSGLRVGFLHGYSEGTYEALFRMIEQALAEGTLTLDQVRALRISTEHNPIIRPDQVQKMAKYNIMPGFNGYQIQGDIKGGAFLKTYGEQFMTWMAPVKSLMDAGAHPVFNTDVHLRKVPVQFKDMDYPEQWDGNIWGFIEFFVTRRMPSDGVIYNRAEAMDRVSMMKAATIWGAEQLLNEKNIGSLEVGKLADFIVTDKDFFAVPEDQIHTIKTLLTAVGGKVVYKDSGY